MKKTDQDYLDYRHCPCDCPYGWHLCCWNVLLPHGSGSWAQGLFEQSDQDFEARSTLPPEEMVSRREEATVA